MKQASTFEVIAARGWNLLNEGKPFTPIFVVGTMLLFYVSLWGDPMFWQTIGLSLFLVLPLLALFYYYDFPLMLRNYLWLPFVAYLIVWSDVNLPLLMFATGLYFFFTVFFWGTFYYHLRIGTSWFNFTRFWKLVLKNSDSTSGNAQEQLPKFLLLLSLWELFHKRMYSDLEVDYMAYIWFLLGVWALSWILHRYLFDWKPAEKATFTEPVDEIDQPSDKVVMIVIDGMRKERFQEANTPFLDKLKQEGTEYAQMETVYPARTVVCFSSMMTGTYPKEHGIKSNMVWNLGIKVESVFDSLRKIGKKGRLLGVAHLIDAMGDDVEAYTAVAHNDSVDRNILENAKQMMEQEDLDFFNIQLISTDQTGHSRGVLYDDYIQKIEEADSLIEEFVSWMDSKGFMKNTTLLICADHGQADGIGGHGHLDEGERYVPFFMHGPSIESGKVIEDKHSLISVAPTIAHLLQAPCPNYSRGEVLTDALKLARKEPDYETESHRIPTSS
ncbi:sulfatase-like hydrolase/transferase [Pontibacillus yanchengensis]|uniref:Sulfatase-like hydrolase/transferase n=2 Tax=Pontibacillus yanchengensis TaxID=462910 RepID=A0ACC7VBJ1_9BACI|nr:alkaline phosphatase family protein [Pontibacillus yanchengensis]MYL34746.1 sulfatase-like hydrolase/transferase [Pontibacillus yanchengensis]MYL52268.1 sulfatase-like hydrolase/transferase [Pontibacillus yanchengensis]